MTTYWRPKIDGLKRIKPLLFLKLGFKWGKKKKHDDRAQRKDTPNDPKITT